MGETGIGNTSDADAEPTLSRWPIARPPDWTLRVNMPMTPPEEEADSAEVNHAARNAGKSARPHDSD